MNKPTSEGISNTKNGDETQISTGHHPTGKANNADNSSRYPVMSEVVVKQIRAAIDPQTKQLEHLSDSMKEFRQAPPRRSEETSSLIPGASRAPSQRFDQQKLNRYLL